MNDKVNFVNLFGDYTNNCIKNILLLKNIIVLFRCEKCIIGHNTK